MRRIDKGNFFGTLIYKGGILKEGCAHGKDERMFVRLEYEQYQVCCR
jgi:hypothetical protein